MPEWKDEYITDALASLVQFLHVLVDVDVNVVFLACMEHYLLKLGQVLESICQGVKQNLFACEYVHVVDLKRTL